MRLSKPRLALRAVLLLVLAGFMAWRAVETGALARTPGLAAGDAALYARIGLIEWILAGLAVLTAGAALLALRRKPPPPSIRLRGGPGGPAPGDAPGGEPPDGGR